ncbi:MAG: MMPL family transporter, partial [Halobaculum sp.]
GPPRQVPTLDEQIEQLASMSPAEVREVTATVLAPDSATDSSGGPPRGGPGSDPYALLPTSYEPGSTTAEARVLFVFQRATGGGDSLPTAVVDAQLAMQELADRKLGGGAAGSETAGSQTAGDGTADAFVFGAGIVDEESGRATGESFALISPVALLFIVVVLTVAYRDLFDVVLALLGVVLVLVWMGGFMGWAGFGVTQIVIAVPFLLIGLSIDYALHVVMRYREARTGSAGSESESAAADSSADDEPTASVRDAMRAGLGGVVVALAATTFTTAVGFLSNTVSPITSIAEFGAISAAGIVAAFVVFAGLLPAVKVELDGLLERFGVDRERRAFGTDGVASRLVGVGTTVARRAPVVILVFALLVSAGGGYAATDINTSIDQTDFLPRDSPAWMDALPAPFQPSDYTLRENVIYLNDNFLQSRDRSRVEILVEGNVTAPGTLERLAAGREAVAETDSAVTLADGNPSVQGPLSVIRQTAARNATVAAVVERADTDDDGVPDQNLTAVYDAVFAANPDRAAAVFYRTD